MRCVPWKLPSIHGDEKEHCDCNFPTPYNDVQNMLLQTKSKIGDYKLKHGCAAWSSAASQIDKKITLGKEKKPINRAYYKLVELIETCILAEPKTSLHLCEAPGGFVQAALEKYPKMQGAYMHSLLADGAPYFSHLLLHNLKTHLLRMYDGDINCPQVRQGIKKEVETVEFITADGAVDSDVHPEYTEENNQQVLYNEIETALSAQSIGGTLVVKVFGITLPPTYIAIAHLCRCYESVHLTKPTTSRGVNDERYIVCTKFTGSAELQKKVPTLWLQEVQSISSEFALKQTKCIEDALRVDTVKHSTKRQKQ